jgi:hypothetical protein
VSVIEVKLPNPYLNIDKPERNRTIDYQIKSKFKSPFADYLNHSFTNNTSNKNTKLNSSKILLSNLIYNKIHFTKTQNLGNKNK